MLDSCSSCSTRGKATRIASRECIRGGNVAAAGQSVGEGLRVGFIGIFMQQRGKGIHTGFFQQCRCGLAPLRIHPHVERPLELHGKTARRVVDLHGGDAEVGQHHVHARELHRGEDFRQPGKITAVCNKCFHPEPKGAQACLGFGQFYGIGIETGKQPSGLDAREDFLAWPP